MANHADSSQAAKGLPENAHRPLKEGETYIPYIPATSTPDEFTIKALFFGVLFGVLFGAANAYLGLRAGLTISTSIPVAVMTVAAFKVLRSMGGSANILEANLAQTVGSSSSSEASSGGSSSERSSSLFLSVSAPLTREGYLRPRPRSTQARGRRDQTSIVRRPCVR